MAAQPPPEFPVFEKDKEGKSIPIPKIQDCTSKESKIATNAYSLQIKYQRSPFYINEKPPKREIQKYSDQHRDLLKRKTPFETIDFSDVECYPDELLPPSKRKSRKKRIRKKDQVLIDTATDEEVVKDGEISKSEDEDALALLQETGDESVDEDWKANKSDDEMADQGSGSGDEEATL